MSVFTLLLFLITLFTSITVSAPNQRADRLLNSIHAKFQSDQSVQSAFTATASLAAVSSYLSSIDAIPSFPPDRSSSTLGAELSGLGPPFTTASVTSSDPSSSSTYGGLPFSTGNIGGAAAGSVVQFYTIQGARPIPSDTGNVGENSAGGGLQPCLSSDAPYCNSTYTFHEGEIGKNGPSGSVTPAQLPAQTLTVTTAVTTTVTISYSITAGLIPPYSSNVGLGTGSIAASSYLPPVGASNGSAAGPGLGTDAAALPSSIPPLAPATESVAPVVPASNSGAAVSQANQSSIQIAEIDGGSSLAINLNTIPIFSPHPAGTPIVSQLSLFQIEGFATGTATAQITLPPPVAPPSSTISTTTQTPPPSSSGLNSSCVKNISTQNMTANVRFSFFTSTYSEEPS